MWGQCLTSSLRSRVGWWCRQLSKLLETFFRRVPLPVKASSLRDRAVSSRCTACLYPPPPGLQHLVDFDCLDGISVTFLNCDKNACTFQFSHPIMLGFQPYLYVGVKASRAYGIFWWPIKLHRFHCVVWIFQLEVSESVENVECN